MEGEVVKTNSGNYVRPQAGSGIISREQDLLVLLSACYEAGANKLLLEAKDLDPIFFDLSSGLAGAILLKLSIYQVKTAVVVNPTEIKSDYFQELMRESNKGREINFFNDLAAASRWLVQDS